VGASGSLEGVGGFLGAAKRDRVRQGSSEAAADLAAQENRVKRWLAGGRDKAELHSLRTCGRAGVPRSPELRIVRCVLR
jgi:hypothetical protein